MQNIEILVKGALNMEYNKYWKFEGEITTLYNQKNTEKP